MKQLKTATTILLFLGFVAFSIPQEVSAQRSQMITLAGYKHKPPVRTSGSGIATVTLKGDTLKVEGEFEDLTGNYSGAYVMVSLRRGEGGNQLHSLKVNLNEEKTGGTLKATENTIVLSAAEKELLKKGQLYLNICSFEHRNGELRGDISGSLLK